MGCSSHVTRQCQPRNPQAVSSNIKPPPSTQMSSIVSVLKLVCLHCTICSINVCKRHLATSQKIPECSHAVCNTCIAVGTLKALPLLCASCSTELTEQSLQLACCVLACILPCSTHLHMLLSLNFSSMYTIQAASGISAAADDDGNDGASSSSTEIVLDESQVRHSMSAFCHSC